MTNQNILYLLNHFLNEICTINLLVKQNEIFLNNMHSNSLFESLFVHETFIQVPLLLPRKIPGCGLIFVPIKMVNKVISVIFLC